MQYSARAGLSGGGGLCADNVPERPSARPLRRLQCPYRHHRGLPLPHPPQRVRGVLSATEMEHPLSLSPSPPSLPPPPSSSLPPHRELPTILQLTYGGMADPEIQVRRTSCVALSKLAKECQPEVSENHADLLPRLFHAMDDASSDVRESACYALEQVIDNMGKGGGEWMWGSVADSHSLSPPSSGEAVVPYLAELMERMMYMTGLSDDMHQVALGCIAVISRAAEIEFLPYMESTVTHLRSLLEIRDFERLNLVLQAIGECVGEGGVGGGGG